MGFHADVCVCVCVCGVRKIDLNVVEYQCFVLLTFGGAASLKEIHLDGVGGGGGELFDV